MNYFPLLFFTMIILCGSIMAIDRDNDDHALSNNKFKITKYGINCPLDIDLKKLIKEHYNELFGKQKKNRDIEQKFIFENKGALWEASIRDVGPGLDINRIDETILIYHFNHRSDWCMVDFSMEKKIEYESGTILKHSQIILSLNFTKQAWIPIGI